MSDPILLDIDGPIARVALNRPEAVNAMDQALRNALRKAQATLHANDEVRVVILSGSGRGFCAGTDLVERHDLPTGMMLDVEYRPILSAISTSPKIWIAQVHGAAAGIGAALAMNCDLMTMADNATIYMAFAAIGLVPDGGNTWLLHRSLGYKRALQAILEGRRIPADEAVATGIANAAFAEDALADETFAMAQRIAAGAPLAMTAAKRLLRQMDGMSYDNAISAEGVEQTVLTASDDTREAVTAFFEKRKPVFRGS